MASRKARVLHFVEDGDTSGFFPQLARFHDRSRFEMILGTLKPITAELRAMMAEQGVEVVNIAARSRTVYPQALLRLAVEMRRRRIDVLHTHLFDPSVVGLAAGVLAQVPVRVMTRHYSDYHTRIKKQWHIRLDRMCTSFAHRVIAISHETKRVMVTEEGAPDSKVTVIHNGIDFARVARPSSVELELLRRECDLDGKAVITVAARLHPEKGHEHLFRAMPALVARSDRPVCLLVAGTGPFRSAYEAEVRRLGVSDVVRFLGFRSDPARLFAVSDVVVLPSVAEGFGLALAEAMALERAVVATRVGGIPEIVEDGVSGVLVPAASPEDLGDAILALLKDPERRRELGLAGRARVEQHFRFETMMRRYEGLYDDLRVAKMAGRRS